MKDLRKILLLVCAVCLLLCAVPVTAAGIDEAGATVRIAYHNLAFGNQVYILYAVDAENIGDAKPFMEFWKTSDTNRTPDRTVSASVYRPLKADETKNYYVFGYTDLTAQQMADIVYARAGVTVNGVNYYSEVDSYSICEYAARQLGIMPDYAGTKDEQLKAMLRSMLQYGADAQRFFNYRTDCLANEYYLTLGGKSATQEESFLFSTGGDTATLEEYKGTGLNEVVIPAKLKDGRTVTAIKSKAFENADIKEIRIPGTVKTIGDYAFKNCSQLTTVTLAEGVEQLGSAAFDKCKKLVSLTLPASLNKLGNSAIPGSEQCEELSVHYNGTEAQLNRLLATESVWASSGSVRFVLADGSEIVKRTDYS